MSLDKTFCRSSACQNKCGRKFTEEIEASMILNDIPRVSMAYFCDGNGQIINEEE